MLIKEIPKWKFNYCPWMKYNPKIIIKVKAQSLGKSEEVIKGVFTLPRH